MKSTRKTIGTCLSLLSVLLIFLTASCEEYRYKVEEVDPDAVVSFDTVIQPLFTSNCISCHGAIRNPDLREGKSYESLTKGGYVTLPAETSRLYSTITSGSHISYLDDPEKQKVLYWIEQGARDN